MVRRVTTLLVRAATAPMLALLLSSGVVRAEDTAGIGAALGVEGTNVVILKILPDTPAAASRSVRAGDRLLSVAEADGIPAPLRAGQLADAVRRVRGPKGSIVRLTLLSPGDEPSRARVVTLTRGEIKELARWGNGQRLPVGTDAPDIEMVRLDDGVNERLSQHRGKVVVLEFWATWCGPCQTAMEHAQELVASQAGWKDRVVFITASVDEERTVAAEHVRRKGWTRTHHVWLQPAASKAYQVESIPAVYVVDPQGRIGPSDTIDLASAVDLALKRSREPLAQPGEKQR